MPPAPAEASFETRRCASLLRMRSCGAPVVCSLTRSPATCPPRQRPRPRSRCPASSAPPTFASGCAPAPFGTTGKKNPATNTPRSSSACARFCASRASPSITGMIGVSPGRTLKPAFSTPARNRLRMRLQKLAPVVGFNRDLERLRAHPPRSAGRASWKRDRAAPFAAGDRRSAARRRRSRPCRRRASCRTSR